MPFSLPCGLLVSKPFGVLLADVSRFDPPAVVVLILPEPMNRFDGVIVKEPTMLWLVMASDGDKFRVPRFIPPGCYFWIFSRLSWGVFFILSKSWKDFLLLLAPPPIFKLFIAAELIYDFYSLILE